MGRGQDLYLHAKQLIPGGTELLSKRPEMFLPDGWPAYYSRCKGARIWDLDGREYLDFATMGVGACVLGYADDEVDAAVIECIRNGSMSSLNAVEEVTLAERLVAIHPWADMARFSKTGGEACAIAVRIARAASGRSRVAFCGYHGWHDWYLSANIGDSSNLDGQLLPGLDPAGVPRELKDTAVPFFYNDLASLEALTSRFGDIGVIIMEPVRGHIPEPGFLEGVREIATRIGAVLIFDEVTSGFRVNFGGVHLTLGVEPDVAVFGKALGNGYPISAVIGRAPVMDAAQTSFISSTFWTERIGYVAALATLEKTERLDVPAHLVAAGRRIKAAWRSGAHAAGLDVHISGLDALSHIDLRGDDPLAAGTLFTQAMLDRGFLAGASAYSTLAYDDEVLDAYAEAAAGSFAAVADAAASDGGVRGALRGGVRHAGFKRLA
ncbi:MAG: aminotransferase class III-fold pyridoxal phosphate-dependent enzyme [Coriobacteriia bacterium]|nr:aminotransferase class III-fold pyridoxal phosphate-dependent enzyme [Coriobacteriia bacterium]